MIELIADIGGTAVDFFTFLDCYMDILACCKFVCLTVNKKCKFVHISKCKKCKLGKDNMKNVEKTPFICYSNFGGVNNV